MNAEQMQALDKAMAMMADAMFACHEAGGKAYGVWASLLKTAGRAGSWEALRGAVERQGTTRDESLSEAHRIVGEALARYHEL